MKARFLAIFAVTAIVAAVVVAGQAGAERMQSGNLIVSVNGEMNPQRLPRTGVAPVAVTVSADFSTADDGPLPRMRRIKIRIGSRGRVDATGLPICPAGSIKATTLDGSLTACRSSLVGHGHLRGDLSLPGQPPSPFSAAFLVFNARSPKGMPTLLGSVHSDLPPVSFSLPFVLHRQKGAFGTVLTADLPRSAGKWARITHFDMTIQRRYRYRGRPRSYLSAGCSVPKGFTGIVFPLAQTTFDFVGGRKVAASVVRSCHIRQGEGGRAPGNRM